MFYREVGDLKTTYRDDQAVLTITQERFFVYALIAFMYLAVPFIADEFWLNTIIIPTLIFSLAALGLNLFNALGARSSMQAGDQPGDGQSSYIQHLPQAGCEQPYTGNRPRTEVGPAVKPPG